MVKYGEKVKKTEMPEGWTSVKWADGSGKVWKSNIPTSTISTFRRKVYGVGGMVIKEEK